MRKQILIMGGLFLSMVAQSQSFTNAPIVFRNTGKMNIQNTSTPSDGHTNVTMNVVGSVKMTDSPTQQVLIDFTGGIALTGHFIQDSQGTVFKTKTGGTVYENGKADGYSFMSFRGTEDQFVTTTDSTTFNRAVQYLPFSGIEIATNSNVVIPSKLGIDAASIKKKAGSNGVILLRSNPGKNNVSDPDDNNFDASLRITATGTTIVDPGAVVVERYFQNYKNTGAGGSQGSALMPFATPFNGSQVAGYFAGHWMRRATNDYIYGDKLQGLPSTVIHRDQYVLDPHENITPGRAFLIKPRVDSEFNQQLIDDGALLITAGAPQDYIKPKFKLNGDVYTFTHVNESLNTQPISSGVVSTKTDQMVNVVIGNSSTASIGFDKLFNYLNSEVSLPVGRYIYAYTPGANSYTAFDLLAGNVPAQNAPASLISNTDIPAMGVYIIRLAKSATTQSGEFVIDPKLYSHGSNGHNMKAASFDNEVLLKAVNVDNTFQYDLAAIGIREKATESLDNLDMQKMTGTDGGLQLYTISGDNVKLASNSVPETTEKVILCAETNGVEAKYKIVAQRLESLRSDVLILEDIKTGTKVDLFETPQYEFEVDKGDDPKRFIVHLKEPKNPTAIDQVDAENIRMFFAYGQLNVWGLTNLDMGQEIAIYNIQGQKLFQSNVTSYPQISIPVNLPKGVFIAKLAGKNNMTVKFSN